MTIPSDFRTQAKTIGPATIKHPVYTFRVNLDRQRSERIGPNTNQRNVNVLHPDMYDSSPDRGRTNAEQHKAGNITLLPGFLGGENVIINDDGTITAYGQKAIYLKKLYADISDAFLTLTNVSEIFEIAGIAGAVVGGAAQHNNPEVGQGGAVGGGFAFVMPYLPTGGAVGGGSAPSIHLDI